MKVVAEPLDFFADTPAETEMMILIRNALDKQVMDAYERELKGVSLEGEDTV